MSSHLIKYLQDIQQRLQARSWLRANDPHPIAAYALFRLNRHARVSRSDQQSIYSLKNNAVRLFCQMFPYRAKLQIQDRYCYSCEGSGTFWTGEECNRCGGTGIYSRFKLYLFIFEICGRHYSWHQPANLVDWSVELTGDVEDRYETRLGDDQYALEESYRSLLIWALYEYLRLHGQAPVFILHSLSFALQADLYNSRLATWLRNRKYRHSEEEIPF